MFVFLYLLGALVYSSGKSLVAELPKYEGRLDDIVRLLEGGVGPLKVDLASAVGNLDIGKIAAVILAAIGPFFSFLGKRHLVRKVSGGSMR